MTSDHSRRIGGFALFLGLLIAAFFLLAAPAHAATAEDAATAVFGPTIDNVPWEYIPAWYKTELLARGYTAPADSSMPPVAPTVAAVSQQIYGPTLANVPWEYVPEWYKAQLAAEAASAPVTSQMPQQEIHTIANDVPSLNALEEVPEIEKVGKESAEKVGASVDGSAFEADERSAGGASSMDRSFMSQTSFFFLAVFLIFVVLMLVSAFKQRSRTPEPEG